MVHRRHRKHFSKRRNSKNIMNKSLSFVKTTSKKIVPKVTSGLKNVGTKVVKVGENSIPFLQRTTRKFLGMFSNKSKKHRRR